MICMVFLDTIVNIDLQYLVQWVECWAFNTYRLTSYQIIIKNTTKKQVWDAPGGRHRSISVCHVSVATCAWLDDRVSFPVPFPPIMPKSPALFPNQPHSKAKRSSVRSTSVDLGWGYYSEIICGHPEDCHLMPKPLLKSNIHSAYRPIAPLVLPLAKPKLDKVPIKVRKVCGWSKVWKVRDARKLRWAWRAWKKTENRVKPTETSVKERLTRSIRSYVKKVVIWAISRCSWLT